MSNLAVFNEVDERRAVKDQYIVILKDQNSTGILSKTLNSPQTYLSLSQLNAKQRKAEINTMALDIASKVNGQIKRQFHTAVNGFVLNMNATEIETIRKDSRVAIIEQDQILTMSVTQVGATWGLDRIDQSDLPLDDNYTYNLDGSGVNAYIIDTGVLTSHGDFAGRAVSGWDFVDNDPDASDCNGHGTHVAGTVGGSTWGVAKNVNLTAIRVLGCNGSGTNSGVIAGVDWVAENAVFPAVANMSLGGGNSAILDAAVNNAIDAGITFAVAAGNSNINACSGSPNRVAAAITVASSTSNDSRSSFSNWGSCVDIFAPGSDITSTWSNGGSNTISGTSMASPHVAGAIALYLQAHPNSTPAEVDAGLSGFATSDKISNLNGSPNLLLNVGFDAGSEILPPPPPPPVEKVTFEISDDQLVKSHLLTLTGLAASTIYQCTVSSSDIDNTLVSENIRATTSDVADITPPTCNGTPSVTGFVNSAQISWSSDELTTASIEYKSVSSDNWLNNGTITFATEDSLLLTGLIAETFYEQQITLTDQSGNSSQCP
ncbi:MAG: S8 family peptidase, partial [Proteobacteria bacterium]|nr:S8 family peptidase [Pseudomonadota bacterium]